ncbi:hypothetical protein B0H13DRAFT_2359822 [Mycena leptocephala]|nr:hypothetical protein B0H13DRAFT_2359822 [Mycena leptocephala]
MLYKLSVLLATVLATLATATPQGPPKIIPPTSLQCCNTVLTSTTPIVIEITSAFKVDVTQLSPPIPVGLNCEPVDLPVDCGAIAVICDVPDPTWEGFFALDCIPVTL